MTRATAITDSFTYRLHKVTEVSGVDTLGRDIGVEQKTGDCCASPSGPGHRLPFSGFKKKQD